MTAGSPACLMTSSASSASSPHENVSRDHEVDAGLDRPAHLLLEHGPDRCSETSSSGSKTLVLQMLPAKRAPLSRRDLLRDRERCPVHRLEQVLLADQPQLLPVRVVRERLDDIRARVDELAVELGDELRMLQDDLGHVRAGLEVPAPLELEEVSLGADHRAGLELFRKAELLAVSGVGHLSR